MDLRKDADLYFDTGDCIKAGNLAIPIGEEPVWKRLRSLDITASVPGNRESHILPAGKRAKFAGFDHEILCANWFDKKGNLEFKDQIIIEVNGIKLGLFGIMVAMVTPNMRTQAASAYLWQNPLETAKLLVPELRKRCDILVALTHIGIQNDRKLAALCPEIDVIFGGHSHTILEHPEKVGNTWICQGGSHGRFVGSYGLDPEKGLTEAALIPWP